MTDKWRNIVLRTCRLGERLLKEDPVNKTAAACSAEYLWDQYCTTPYEQKNLSTCYYYFAANYNNTHYERGIAGIASGTFQRECR